MTYRILFKLVIQRFPPEAAHAIAARTLSILGKVPGFRTLLRRLFAPADHSLQVRAFGLTFPTPLGAAAGIDKNLRWFEELGALGFGFVEVGTVTALAQRGNRRPRIHRLPADRALINSLGFPNQGAAAAARYLRKRTGQTLIAVNIGKSRAATDAIADYCDSVCLLAAVADLLVLNVSSPNTPGLRDMQTVDALSRLVRAVRAELETVGANIPLLVKISPDLEDAEIDAIAQAALDLGLAGIVAVNTTTSRGGLASGADIRAKRGGLSGPPLTRRALEVLRQLHARTKGDLVLVSVGGVETAADVLERIRAGATLVQAYTGFVYEGPDWPRRINRGLIEHLRATGVARIQDLVGADKPVADSQQDPAGSDDQHVAITSHDTSPAGRSTSPPSRRLVAEDPPHCR